MKIVIIYIPALFVIYLAIYLSNVSDTGFLLDTAQPNAKTVWTYSFFHYNSLHIATNLVTLAIYGGICEYEQGPIRTFVINTYAIFLGAVGSVLEARATHEDSLILGASGGIYGLLASISGYLAINWKECEKFKKFMYIIILASECISDIVINTVYLQGNVAYGNHLGGFIGGALMSIAVSRNDVVLKWETTLRIFCAVLVSLLPLLLFV
jgi:membrane associated rhomboid family serine protease